MANGPGKRFLVLDVGGSGIKYATATASGELGPRETLLTSYTTHKEFIDAIVGIVEANRPVDGIAISTCGELDPATGYMYTGGALTFNAGTNFITALEGRCGLPTTVENDANCALIAEMRDGALTDVDSGVVIVLGTAIGGAIMLGREVYHGARFHSGHFSFLAVNVEDVEHVPVAFSGAPPACWTTTASCAGRNRTSPPGGSSSRVSTTAAPRPPRACAGSPTGSRRSSSAFRRCSTSRRSPSAAASAPRRC